MAAPPVARMSLTCSWRMSSSTASMVGSVMQPMAPLGQPAASAAAAMRRAVSSVQRLAPGWGEKTMVLPAFSAIMAL